METLFRQILVGLERKEDWEDKLKSFMSEIVTQIGLDLEAGEREELEALPQSLENIILAGLLHSVAFDFGGESCDVAFEYYPAEDDQDDLDLSFLNVVDWDVKTLEIRLKVTDAAYASELTPSGLDKFNSEKLTVTFEQVQSEDGEITFDDEPEPEEVEITEEINDTDREEVS